MGMVSVVGVGILPLRVVVRHAAGGLAARVSRIAIISVVVMFVAMLFLTRTRTHFGPLIRSESIYRRRGDGSAAAVRAIREVEGLFLDFARTDTRRVQSWSFSASRVTP